MHLSYTQPGKSSEARDATDSCLAHWWKLYMTITHGEKPIWLRKGFLRKEHCVRCRNSPNVLHMGSKPVPDLTGHPCCCVPGKLKPPPSSQPWDPPPLPGAVHGFTPRRPTFTHAFPMPRIHVWQIPSASLWLVFPLSPRCLSCTGVCSFNVARLLNLSLWCDLCPVGNGLPRPAYENTSTALDVGSIVWFCT